MVLKLRIRGSFLKQALEGGRREGGRQLVMTSVCSFFLLLDCLSLTMTASNHVNCEILTLVFGEICLQRHQVAFLQ